MDPLTLATIASAGVSLFNGFSSARSAQAGQAAANQQNIELMDHQAAIQENQYRHRHQWEVQDLRDAGLNPILSATNGAPVPGGVGLAHVESEQKQSSEMKFAMMKTLSDMAVNSALIRKTNAETDNLKGQISVPGFFRAPVSSAISLANQIKKTVKGSGPIALGAKFAQWLNN